MSDEKGSEKFNTVFLVSQIQNERQRTVKIGLAVAGVLVLAIIYFLFIKEPAPPELPHGGAAGHPAAAAPATPPTAPGAVPAPAAPAPAQPAVPAPAPK